MDSSDDKQTSRPVSVIDLIDSDSNDVVINESMGGAGIKRRYSVIDIADSDSNSSALNGHKITYDGPNSQPSTSRPRKKQHFVDSCTDSDSESYSESESSEDIEWVESSSSDSESETENENWDQDCVVLPIVPRNNVFSGYCKLESTEKENADVNMESESISLNEFLKTDELQTTFLKNWTENTPFSDENIDLISDPFKLCTINQLIDDKNVLNSIRKEMDDLKWDKRRLDLYELFQTQDLVSVNSKYIQQAYNFLKTDVMPWVSKVTGLELTHISASCSMYTHSDFLLVHDDLKDDRSVAFILYITNPMTDSKNEDTESWSEEFGGALQLFDSDSEGQPNKPVREIFPRNNQFAFFQVTPNSYHQVGEIKTMDYSRLSINGWFHNNKLSEQNPPRLSTPTDGLFGSKISTPIVIDDLDLKEWITHVYLETNSKAKIQSYIEENSEISLSDYFVQEKCANIANELNDKNIKWKWVGPPNRRLYEVADEETLPPQVQQLTRLFYSAKMFSLLREYTDLDLEYVDSEYNPGVKIEMQRWTPQCYSLMSESRWFSSNELDVILYFGCCENQIGGQVLYVSQDEEQQNALITVTPCDNRLNVVFRDSGTARIVPHVSDRNRNQQFYMLVCTYKE